MKKEQKEFFSTVVPLMKLGKENVKYVIAKKGANNRLLCDFVSTLSHEFAGEKEVLEFSRLNDAILFDNEEEANKTFYTQPRWVHEKCTVLPIEKTGYGECYLL